jgi:predicted RNase H-like nuclease
MRVVGVDGCRQGWLCAVHDEPGQLSFELQPDLESILAAYPDAVCVGIDIPIGLTCTGYRDCDRQARRLLGWPRSASVFLTPPRDVVDACEQPYPDVLALAKDRHGAGISSQTYAIGPRISRVNAAMSPERQLRVREVHPEVSFWAMAGGHAMQHGKKTLAGFAERRHWLVTRFLGAAIPATRTEARRMAPWGGADDLLDALAAAWTALRVARGEAGYVPSDPPIDARGLKMEIVI